MSPHPLMTHLARVRRAAGLSQAAVARWAGLTRESVAQIEGGRRVGSLASCEALAKTLGFMFILAADGPVKVCTECGEMKRDREFPLRRLAADGRDSTCLACKQEQAVQKRLLRVERALPNELRTAACDQRFKLYAGLRDVGLEHAEAAEELVAEFGLTERTAQRYKQRYQANLTEAAA